MPRCLASSPMSKDKRNMPTSLTIDTVTGPRHSWWRAVVPLSTNDGPPLPPQWYALRMHPLWLCNEWPRETGCGSFYNLRCSNLRTNSLERNIASLVSILQLLESLLNFGGKSGDIGPIHRIREKTPKIGGAENPGWTSTGAVLKTEGGGRAFASFYILLYL